MGDITNLAGCILAHQLPPQTATAIYFVIIDMALFLEYVWYGHKNKKTAQQKEEEKEKEKERLLTSESFTDPGTDNSKNKIELSIKEDGSHPGSGSELGSGSGSGLKLGSKSGSDISIKGILGIVGLGSITYLGIFTLTKTFTSSTSFEIDQRNLLSRSTHQNSGELAGKIVGWISGFMYLISRIPQIIKNYKRKSTEGLSIQMFIAAICGNIAYALGIFLRSTKWDFIKPKIPWLVGSIGTCGFDCTIFTQFLYYRNRDKKNLKNTNKEDYIEKVANSDSQSDQAEKFLNNDHVKTDNENGNSEENETDIENEK
ncbi:lysosomal amino acid transporter [Anaeramoeba flamelloides]|uniref:Lysosomal amino acid transporter n=1 Tax=Anaeramoeba flamelloides TaxID=1746091 RepID=A0AAV7YHN5_9EUKA|nr:lysosomal amino acid transporter [Anaeramoeba flamelloides]